MNDVRTELRETFDHVADAVLVPPFDELELRARVRSGSRRRTARRVVAVAAAAVVAAMALVAVPPLLDGDGSRDTGVAGGSAPELTASALPHPLYFVAGGRLVAAAPDGEVHDLGRFEDVVGSTAEGVLAVDGRSVPVWVAATSSGDGDHSYTFEPGAGPVDLPDTGPVQSVELSGDGRYLAWLGLDDVVTFYDLKARALIDEFEVGPEAHVTAVSARGVLVAEDGRLELHGEPEVAVPTAGDGGGWLSDTAGDLVSVADRDDVTRVYDVTKLVHGDTAKLVDEVPGTGRLAPYAEAMVTVDGPSVQVWTGDPGELAGLHGAPQSAGWFDERFAVVTTAEAGGTAIYLCPVADLSCTRVAFSEDDVRLGG